jgi:murein DD-endopeptidase MepM/ murein hydrolase activator NlpD
MATARKGALVSREEMGAIRRRRGRLRSVTWWRSISWALPLAVLAVAFMPERSGSAAPLHLLPPPQYDPAQVRSPGLELQADASLPLEGTLDRGESLSQLLAEVGLDARDRHLVSAALAQHVELRRLRPGVQAAAYLGGQPRPAVLQLYVPGSGRLHLAASDDGWESRWEPAVQATELRRVSVEIESSLSGALTAAGHSAEVSYRIADVLQWDVDFGRDLRRGDRLQALYEQVLVDGRPTRTGNVLAVALWNRGRLVEAYGYGDGGAYYDAEGRPLRKMFLRSPLAFSTRITSGFSHRRFHPVLKSYRPHWGVDYGAPTGTPVRATADGVVLSAGWDGGGGKVVKLRHPGGYMTAYLHLSRFAEGVSRGGRVRQGEVIGYVGSTGLSTAPHLDYRVQHQGKWIDPLSLKSVPAPSLSTAEMVRFGAWREQLRASMQTGDLPDPGASQWQLAAAPPAVHGAEGALGGR